MRRRTPPRREKIAATVLAILFVGVSVLAWVGRPAPDAARKPAVRLDAPIPRDTSIRTGELPNHLRYFIRPNSDPERRAELRLVINAGSVLEADDQRGLAHAVEHMLFRGTKRFPGHAVDNYLQSLGMRSGSDINASTSVDETIVRFTIPTDRAGVIDTALAILADMAHDATFDSTEARHEAGVVLEEWRSRSDASQRLRDERNAMLFAGSPYVNHATIGDTAVLRRFDVGAMRRFYADWYRPDLMAVVAVGDFDAATIQRLVEKLFSELPDSRAARVRPEIIVPRAAEPRVMLLDDPEANASSIAVWHPRRPIVRRTLADYRASLVDLLFRDVLSARLEDASERPGSPILNANVDVSTLARSLDADIFSVRAMDTRERAALEMLVTEIARLGRYGVSADEVKRRASSLLRDRRKAEEWRDNSGDLAAGFVNEFLTGGTSVDRDVSYELTRDLLPTIGAADILARARAMSIDSGTVLIMTAPPRAGANRRPPGIAADLIALARAASVHATPPPHDSTARVALLPIAPAPGRVAAERHVSDTRLYDWTLANGMRVILKPTHFAYDDIEFRIIGPGGASLAPDADYPSAYLSDVVIKSTGVGPMNGTSLDRLLDTTSIIFTPAVRDDAIEITGSTAPVDLELLFKLLHLHFTAPRADTVAFRRFQERAASYARGRTSDPDAIFADSVAAISTQYNARALRNDPRFASAVSLPKALAFWKERMSNASGFTLVMAGDFTLDRVRPLIARYLASLPAGTPERVRDTGARFPGGITRRQIVAGAGPTARTEIILSGVFDGTSDANTQLSTATDLAELALTDRLRQQLGGTYDASVESSITLGSPLRYAITIDFEASPDRIDLLTTAAMAELNRLRTTGPTDGEFDKVRAAMTRDLDGETESNSYWASELSWHARMRWPLNTIANHQLEARLLSKSSANAACAAYLRTDAYVQFTMYPKPNVPQSASARR